MNLAGKSAIVTGASRGIGTYIAQTLSSKSINIIAIASDDELEEDIDIKTMDINNHKMIVDFLSLIHI